MSNSEPRGWIKGQSAHPQGRRIRAGSWPDLLTRIGRERVAFDDDGDVTTLSREERLARILWTRALDGDLKAAQMLLADLKPIARQATTLTLTLEDLAASTRLTATRRTLSDGADEAGGEDGRKGDAGPDEG